jgi:hypothetical protein
VPIVDIACSLDQLVGAKEKRLWDRQPNRLCGLFVDHKLNLVGCSTAQIGGLCPFRILSM